MIIRNRHIIFFLFLILSLNVFPLNCDKSSLDSLKQLAFSREVDSLSKILTERILTKTDRALLYATLAEAYMELNNDSSFAMAKRGLDLAKELNDYKALAENYKVLGMLAYLNDSLHTAKLYYLLVEDLFDKYQSDDLKLHTWMMLGLIFELQGDFDKALHYDQKGLRLADSTNNKIFSAKFYNNTSIVYSVTEDYRNAIVYAEKAGKLFKELGDEIHYANTLVNQASEYLSLGNNDSARFYIDTAIIAQYGLNHYYGLINVYAIAGELYLFGKTIIHTK